MYNFTCIKDSNSKQHIDMLFFVLEHVIKQNMKYWPYFI